MQTPVEIDFQDMSARPDVHASIEKHVADLEQRYGRVTACRVVLKGPGGHHRTGGLYEVNIRLALPNGREVNVGRTARADERQADLSFAINDAFKHARRRLQDHVRRMQGQVKQHEGQPIGTVKSLDASGAFGFLAAADGHFPHDAEVGVEGWGLTVAEAFEQAAHDFTAVVTPGRSEVRGVGH